MSWKSRMTPLLLSHMLLQCTSSALSGVRRSVAGSGRTMAKLSHLLVHILLGGSSFFISKSYGQNLVAAPGDLPLGVPRWNTTVPDPTKPWAGMQRLPANTTQTNSVYRANPKVGTYNHGPMIVEYGGLIIVNWYAGQRDEDAPGERVLFAWSEDDGATFTAPEPMFDRLSPTAAVGTPGVIVSNQSSTMRRYSWSVPPLFLCIFEPRSRCLCVCFPTLRNMPPTYWSKSRSSNFTSLTHLPEPLARPAQTTGRDTTPRLSWNNPLTPVSKVGNTLK